MESKAIILLVLCGLLALQMTQVEGVCYNYVCRRRCVYQPPRYEEYAFRYLWPRACGRTAVQRYGLKACCANKISGRRDQRLFGVLFCD
ncbi:hypothetical protein ACF0H5_019826 [Mactra antiquata]